MTRYGVPVHVSTYHWLDVEVPDGLGAAGASVAADQVRAIPPEQVRRTLPVGTTTLVGTPVPELEGAGT